MKTVAEFAASDLKSAGAVLDAATRGPVRIRRRSETFVLLRAAELEKLLAEAADPRPQTLEDLVADYDPAEMRARLGAWLDDPPVGKELL